MPILTEQERCGTQLAGKYRIEAVVGRGGMGVVFRATHLHTQRVVAIKILRPELSQDPTLGRRFVREARAATRLRHPNVVEVLDLGIEPDGTVYQVLELLQGEPLSGLLARKGSLPLAQTLEILMPVMGALAEAHAQGIVHRDLKPDNIFLSRAREGRVTPTLLDFGIAKLVDAQGSFATNAGSVMGTPEYMAPEQARGGDDQGPALDVWAMGVIAYRCLTGRLPFEGQTPVLVLLRVMTEKAPRLDAANSAVPAAVADVFERALQREQGDRYASMGDLLAALRAAAEAAGVPTPSPLATTTGPLSAPPEPAPALVEAEAETMGALDADRAELAALASPLRARAMEDAGAPTALPEPNPAALPLERAPRPEAAPTLPSPRPRGRRSAVATGLGVVGLSALGLGAALWWTATDSGAALDAADSGSEKRSAAAASAVAAATPVEALQPAAASAALRSSAVATATPASPPPTTPATIAQRKTTPSVGDLRKAGAATGTAPSSAPASVDAARPARRPGALPGVVSW